MAKFGGTEIFNVVHAKVAALRDEYPELPGPLRCVMRYEGIHTISPSFHVDVRLGNGHSWTVGDIREFRDIDQEIRRIGDDARRQAVEAARLSALRRERHVQFLLLEQRIRRWLRRRCPKHCQYSLEHIVGCDSFTDAIYVTVTIPPSAYVTESLRSAEVNLAQAQVNFAQATSRGFLSGTEFDAYRDASADWRAKRLHYDYMASAQRRTWAITDAEGWPPVRVDLQAFWGWFPMNDASGTVL